MTVWLVFDWDSDDRWVVGVFSSKELAEAKSAEMKGDIEEWTLDGARVEQKVSLRKG